MALEALVREAEAHMHIDCGDVPRPARRLRALAWIKKRRRVDDKLRMLWYPPL